MKIASPSPPAGRRGRSTVVVLHRPTSMTHLPAALLSALSAGADRADASDDWPAGSWQALLDAGVLAWSVPVAQGGAGWSSVQLLAAYEQLAGACLTTAFILSQREAAVRRLL